MSQPTYVIASAFGPEARPFREGSLERLPVRVEVAEVGVGLVISAVRTTRLLLATRPAALVFAGTCGAYPGSGLAVGDVVVATRATLIDVGEVDGAAHVPSIYGARDLEPVGPLLEMLIASGARPAHVGTTLSVTRSDALAARIRARTSADVEHLEAQSVAAACVELGVPFAIVLGVANDVSASSHEAWKANHVAVSARVGGLVLRALGSVN